MDNTAKLFSILDVVADTSKYILINTFELLSRYILLHETTKLNIVRAI
jgi:hypothetical protein